MDVCFACEKEGPGKWIPEGEFICDACAASSLAKYGDWRADRCDVCDEHEVCDVEAHERVTAAIIFGFLALGTWAAERADEHEAHSFGRCGVCGVLRTGASLALVTDGTGTCRACRLNGLSYPKDRARDGA